MAFSFFKKKEKKIETEHEKNEDGAIDPEGPLNSEQEEETNEVQEPAQEQIEDHVNAESSEIEKASSPPAQAEKNSTGFFTKLKKGLSKTREILTTDVDKLFTGNRTVDDDLLEDLEELLITSDIGVGIAMDLMEKITKKASKITNANDLKKELKNEIISLIDTDSEPEKITYSKPHVIMVVGVNGVGKTTTIGKLSAKYTAEGKKVLISAADTFRAAAGEQLSIWAERTGADFVRHRDNADPGAVAFDSIEAAVARNVDIVLIDTAGRLHTKVNLMEELKKIKRVVSSRISAAPHEVLLVLDATTGQNALSQAKLFHETIGVSGIALTKLDGTAKGGIVINIGNNLNIPIRFIGIGEQVDDLQEFNIHHFVEALF